MLSDSLNTNQIKNAAGVEVEFELQQRGDKNSAEFRVKPEPPALQHRLKINHQEIGEGIKRRRRSRVGFDKMVMSDVDATVPAKILCYTVVDAPVGALTTNAEIANVIAEQVSFLASTGADTTIKFDCTGNGAATLLHGSL